MATNSGIRVTTISAQPLTHAMDISVQDIAPWPSPGPEIAVIKVEEKEEDDIGGTNVKHWTSSPSTGQRGCQGSLSFGGGGGGPLVIDLTASDDEEEYSKERIEDIPATSLNGLLAKIKLAVTSLPREELEEMFCSKISEFAEMDKQYRKLEMKFGNFLVYNDKVIRKVALLEKQAEEMEKLMHNVTECVTRSPQNTQQAFTPIKFLRTIGVQCRIDPMPRLKPSLGTSNPSINTLLPPLVPMKKVTSSVGTETNGSNGSPQKRLNKSTADFGGGFSQIERGLPPPKMRRPGPDSRVGVTSVQSQFQTKPQQSTGLTNGAAAATNGSAANVNGSVDLRGSPASQNGRLGKLAPGIQIVTSSAGGATQYQVVSSLGHGRSLLRQIPPRPVVTGQVVQRQASPRRRSIVARNGAPVLPVSVVRQFGPRLGTTVTNGSSPNPGQILMRNPNGQNQLVSTPLPKFVLPELPVTPAHRNKPKQSPPPTTLTLEEKSGRIMLSWTHTMNSTYAEMQCYEIYACQEPLHNYPGKTLSTPKWKRVGAVKALQLPMTCTLSEFTDDCRYHFIVRGVDVYDRTGPFCECVNILLNKVGEN